MEKTATDSLDPRKAAGIDNLKPHIVKKVLPFILRPLCHIFNLSLSTGTFPDKLKLAKVIPLFKKGNANTLSNYRPVSILPCFSKILERLMFNRLNTFLSKFNILYDNQYGFRPGHSTELALADAIDKLYSVRQ